MILKDTTNTVKYNKNVISAILVATGFLLMFSILRACVPLYNPTGDLIKCDAEHVQGEYFVAGRNTFNNAHTQSQQYAFKGKYASKVDTSNHYGFTYIFRTPIVGERYEVSVWRYKTNKEGGALVVSSSEKNRFYIKTTVGEKEENGWELLQMTFNVPELKKSEFLKIYVYSPHHTTYFDELTIKKIKSAPSAAIFNPEAIYINIPQTAEDKLEHKAVEANRTGFIIKKEEDWVGAYLKKNEQQVPIKLRIKGDWLDHVRGKKWSFRVKVKDPHAWKQLKTFSLQTPKSRNFIWEWLFHQFLEKEDILTPRYDFLETFINHEYRGVYAYEEHFDRQLLGHQHRPEGPIVKFTEEAFWLNQLKALKSFGVDEMKLHRRKFINAYEASQIKPFKEKRTFASETLRKQFDIAQNLMYEFKYDLKPIHKIFDVDRLAKYFAIVDVMRAYNGITWHNIRFYYNPITSKLEPIGTDGYSSNKVKNWYLNGQFIGHRAFNKAFNHEHIYTQIFRDEVFVEKYTAYLHKYSSEVYINNFLLDIEPQLKQRIKFIKREFEHFKFAIKEILTHAKAIHTTLAPFNEVSVNAFVEKQLGNTKTLRVTNHHPMPLKVIGFGIDKKTIRDRLKSNKLLESNLEERPVTYLNIKTSRDVRYIFYQLPGLDSIFHATISLWKTPKSNTPEQVLFSKPTIASNDIFMVNHHVILFKKGKHTINANIIIPAGYKISFEAGVTLDFVNRAKFISKSPVFMYGSKNNPITITSSDRSANGFTVLQASDTSMLNYVVFDNLNTLNYSGWTLTGAVTFYESDVHIENCRFVNNHCEDALNLIRCNFDMAGSTIGQTLRDGLDVDFCKGTLNNVTFYKIGNDGADFSGSVVTIDDCTVQETGNKAISIGENATVTIETCEIDKAVIGVASRDLSNLNIAYIDLKNCQQGFAAYQKKSEFGGGRIEVKDYDAYNVKFLHLIEPGSYLKLKKQEITGL